MLHLLAIPAPPTARAAGLALCTLMASPVLAQKAPAEPAQEQLKQDGEKPAAKAPQDPAWLEPIIQRLDSDDLKVRDRASVDLRTDVRLSLDQLQGRIADRTRPLTPEQLLRLNQVAVALFRETPRAAMGVSFARIVPGGVELGLVIDQFDARRVLRVGDVVAEMDGVPIVSLDDARAVIVSHDPGDEMKVTFSRGGEPQQVTVKLGSFRELQNAYNLNDAILREAWVLRCERIAQRFAEAQPQPAPIDAGVSQPQWARAKLVENVAVTRRMQAQAQGEQAIVLDGADVLVGGGALRPLEDIPLLDFNTGGQRRNRSPEALRLQQEIENYQVQIRNLELRLARDATLNENQRRAFQQSAQMYREQVTRKRLEQQKLMRDEALRR